MTSTNALLTWNLAQGFTSYFETVSDKSVNTEGNATYEVGELSFPASTDTDATGQRFAGEVVLRGHRNLMRIVIRDPWVEERDGTILLTVLDEPSTRPVEAKRQEVCSLVVSSDGEPGTTYDASLTAWGASTFGGVYPTGTPMGTITVSHGSPSNGA